MELDPIEEVAQGYEEFLTIEESVVIKWKGKKRVFLKRQKKIFLFIVFILIFTDFVQGEDEEKREAVREEKKVTLKVNRMDNEDLSLPSSFFDLIYTDMRMSLSHQRGSLSFTPLKVVLREKNPGVLIHPEIQIEFSRGGGFVNLSDWTTRRNGTFYVNFDPEAPVDFEKFQVFFVSQSPHRRLDGIIYGAGCDHFYDITSYFQKIRSHQGIAVNTTRDRHVSTLGGSFIFVFSKSRQRIISQVSFSDSHRSDLLCIPPSPQQNGGGERKGSGDELDSESESSRK